MYNGYIETRKVIPKQMVDKNKIEINYLYASLVYYEYINALNNLINFDNDYKKDNYYQTLINNYNNTMTRNLLNEKQISEAENIIVNYYVLYSRAISLACEACESYAKAILLHNNEPLKNLKGKYAHNLFDIYDKFKKDYGNEFSNITKTEEKTIKELSPLYTCDQINIRSRYPGEYVVDDNADIIFKLLEDIRQVSLLCGNKSEQQPSIYYNKNNNLQITEELKEKYTNEINFLNSELMTEELSNMINVFNYNYIFNTEEQYEEEKIDIYTLRSRVIRKSCDVFEHCSIYLNIKYGQSWDESHKNKHSFRKNFNLLDLEDQINITVETLFTLENINEQEMITDILINSDKKSQNILLCELADQRFNDRNGFLGLNDKQKKALFGNENQNISLKTINETMDNLFETQAVTKLNNLSRNPGVNYMYYNASVVLNMALAMANEAFVVDEDKKLQKNMR